MPEVKIRLFGAFRNFHEQPELEVSLSGETMTVAKFKEHLAIKMQGELDLKTSHEQKTKQTSSFDLIGLLQKSAIANDTTFLLESDHVHAGDRLALLPPVSGG